MNGTQLWQASHLVAHHLVRHGYSFGASYPGSPTTLVTGELEQLARSSLIEFHWATNEKIAFEMAAAFAIFGGRAFAVMKHVGLNVAFDAVMAVAYTGHRGALLLIVGDDPSCESSQNEQDTRLAARMLGVPCVEPSAADELPATIELATELSVSTGSLVVVRMTTAICYSSALVRYERARVREPMPTPNVPRSDRRFLLTPAVARESGPRWLARLEEARNIAEQTAQLEGQPDPRLPAFIVQNAIYDEFRQACDRRGVSPLVWRSKLAWPTATESLAAFLGRHETVVVLEEMEPIIEEQALLIAHRRRLSVRIDGVNLRPRIGRIADFDEILARLLGDDRPPRRHLALELPPRPPTFCAGCPHTASFYALKSAVDAQQARPFIASDIGCYTLGTKAGIELGDTVLCMGASIGVATGAALMGQRSMALIGDSTFLHAGLPALKNAVDVGVDLLVCIFDNGVAAMTGGQSASTDATAIAETARGLGAATVEVADPFDVVDATERIRRLLPGKGVSVLVLRSPCALTQPAKPRRPRVDLDACTGCGDCTTKIHCPAISLTPDRKFQVDITQCVGCGLCSVICPEKALTPVAFP